MTNCPVCNRPAVPTHKPFCSARCAEVDLGRWFREDYKVPVPPIEEDEGDVSR